MLDAEESPVTCHSTKNSSPPAANPRGFKGTSGYWTYGALFRHFHLVVTRVTE